MIPGSRRLAFVGVGALMVLLLVQRLCTIDCALPYAKDSDSHLIYTQLELFRLSPWFYADGQIQREGLFVSSIYPHLIGRVAHLASLLVTPEFPPADASLEEHLAFASADARLMRAVVATLSVLIVPGTFALARRFVSPAWSLFAAALAACGLLNQCFSTMARPHAPAAAFVSCALAAFVALRRNPCTRNYVWAGAFAALAIGSLQNGIMLLPAGILAMALSERGPRALLDRRAAIPVACVLLSLLCCWPFLFVRRQAGLRDDLTLEGGELAVSNVQLWIEDFRFGGVERVVSTLSGFEPSTTLLAAMAALLWLARRARRGPPTVERRDVSVVAGYAVPYGVLLCAFDHTMQRFLVPLVPVLACLAAWGLAQLHGPANARWVRRTAVGSALAGLCLPAAVGSRWQYLRTQPTTLELAARWVQERVPKADVRIGLHGTFDLPLVRTDEGLFLDDGTLRRDVYSPWSMHQQRWLAREPDWPGQRWPLQGSLVEHPELGTEQWQDDPRGCIEHLRLDLVLALAAAETAHTPALAGVHRALAKEGALVASFPDHGRPWQGFGGWTTDMRYFFVGAFFADRLGPWVELFDVR